MAEHCDHLIVTVHGIGDTQPGATVDAVAGSLASTSAVNDPVESSILWLEEQDKKKPRKISAFPSHIRKVSTDNQKMVLAETYWADLSRPARGVFNTVKALIFTIFGLEHVVREGAQQYGAKWFDRLSRLMIATLRGPVAAINVVMAVLTVTALLYQFLVGSLVDGNGGTSEVAIWVVVATLLTGGVSYMLCRGQTHKAFIHFWGWVAGISILVLLLAALTIFNPEAIQFFLRESCCNDCTNAMLTGFNAFGMALIQLMQLFWMPLWLASGILCVMWLRTMLTRPQPEKNAITGAYLCMVLMLWLWTLIIPTIWIVLKNSLPEGIIAEELVEKGVALMGLQWSIAGLFVAALLLTTILRTVWKSKHNKPEQLKTSNTTRQPAPRLILARPLRVVLSFIPLLTLAGMFVIIGYELCLQYTDGEFIKAVHNYLDAGRKAAIRVAVICGTLAVPFIPQIATSLDIAQDIISHFNRHNDKHGKVDYHARRRIFNRFQTVLRANIKQYQPQKLTIISHSQGTMIAIENLSAGNLDDVLANLELNLITMGSPFTHLYQHYFPADHQPRTTLKDKLKSWTNLFRIDDFVGTEIEPVDNNAQYPINVPLAADGHTGYWQDKAAIGHIRSIIV